MNEPAAQRAHRLRKFQAAIQILTERKVFGYATVAPPPSVPLRISVHRSENNSRLGYESASTKTSHSPLAAAAPRLRARAIWFTGSNTTMAPAADRKSG